MIYERLFSVIKSNPKHIPTRGTFSQSQFFGTIRIYIRMNMMNRLLTSLLLGLSFASTVSSNSFNRGVLASPVFGVRGGGLFGGNGEKK